MVKQYYLKTGITIITDTEVSENGNLFWIYPTEVGFMPQGTILRPLFSSTKNQRFIPNENVLKNDVLLEDEAGDSISEHYKKSVEDILEKIENARIKEEGIRKLKESGIIIPTPDFRMTGSRIPNFKLPGPK